MLNIVPITFFILFLLFIEDCIYKKDIRNYRIWQSSSRTKSEPRIYSDALPVKILSFIINLCLIIWLIAFVVYPLIKYIIGFPN